MTQAFIDQLAQFAVTGRGRHFTELIDLVVRPVRIAVVGRAGVGRSAVAAALRLHGATVVPAGSDAVDVRVLVIVDTVKPEELAAIRSTGEPVLVALTKADLAGAGPGGPMVMARRRSAAVERATGAPTVPVVGLLGALRDDALDAELIAALRSLVTDPADLSSVDTFLDGHHRVARHVRDRLAELLDRYGIAHAVLALANGSDPGTLTDHLRRLGNVGEVMTELERVAAPVRHRRLSRARAELLVLATNVDDDGVAALLANDATVLATMAAAVDVVEAAGMTVDRGDSPAAHVARARHWRRYGHGPVNGLHRRCSDDIVRGSLRLLTDAAEEPS